MKRIKQPKIIETRLVPRRFSVNVFGTIWTRKASVVDSRLINHELIHTAQMREMLYLPFYLWYVVEWLVRLLQYGNWYKAYENISFEREAYANDSNPAYLRYRSRNAWFRRLLR